MYGRNVLDVHNMDVFKYTCMYVYASVYVPGFCECVYINTFLCMFETCMCMYIHIYMYTSTRVYAMCGCIHTYIHTDGLVCDCAVMMTSHLILFSKQAHSVTASWTRYALYMYVCIYIYICIHEYTYFENKLAV